MRPKEFYEQYTIEEESNHVFALFPHELKDQYLKHIKKPLEKIKTAVGTIVCQSYLDTQVGHEIMDEIWRGIQRASIVIADLTGQNPNVMFELGVALIKKDHVFLIAEKLPDQEKLPIDITQLKVHFYDLNKLRDLTDFLTKEVENRRGDEPDIANADVRLLLREVQRFSRESRFDVALALFAKMMEIEPGNWFIYKEWGSIYKEMQNFEEAHKKFQEALVLTKTNRQKARVYIEMANAYVKAKQVSQGLGFYGKAENLDSDNAELYSGWADAHYIQGSYEEAMNKQMTAVKLDGSQDNRWVLEFYSRKFADESFRMGLREFVDLKKRELAANPPVRLPRASGRGGTGSQGSGGREQRSRGNSPHEFRRFSDRTPVGSVVEGTITNVRHDLGVFVELVPNVTGLVFRNKLPTNFDTLSKFSRGGRLSVKITDYRYDKYQIELALP